MAFRHAQLKVGGTNPPLRLISPAGLLATGLPVTSLFQSSWRLAPIKAVRPAIARLKQIQKASQEHLYRLAAAGKVPSPGEIPGNVP